MSTNKDWSSEATTAEDLILPLVSIVLVNFNYARFLERALESIGAQSYPRVETIIVDDCSTDESRTRLRDLCRPGGGFESAKVVLLDENSGQTVCCARGLAEASGSYVIFMDADDLLLARAVEAHVYAHLSARIPVALTTVDILSNFGGGDVNTSSGGFAAYVASGCGSLPALVRPIDQAVPNSWFGARPPAVPPEGLHFVMPPHAEPWVWSPTSANCFRRDALRPLLEGADLRTIRSSTDGYLIRPLSALHGSLLIDRPLMRYMLHGANIFTTAPPLHRTIGLNVMSKKGELAEMTKIAVCKLMEDVATVGPRYEHPDHFFAAMRALCQAWPGLDRAGEVGGYYANELARHRAALVRGFGSDAFALEAARARSMMRKSRLRALRPLPSLWSRLR